MAYTAPAWNSISLDFSGSYTAPVWNSISLDFSGSYTAPVWNSISLDFSGSYTAPVWNGIALDIGSSGDTETTAITGAGSLTFTTATPRLVFQLLGQGSLSFDFTAELSIHIELAGTAALTFAATPDLTIGYQVQGTVTEMGIPVQRLIRVYDAATGALVDEGQSDPSTGAYLLDLFDHGDDIYVHCLGSASYGPLVHGPVQPERL